VSKLLCLNKDTNKQTNNSFWLITLILQRKSPKEIERLEFMRSGISM